MKKKSFHLSLSEFSLFFHRFTPSTDGGREGEKGREVRLWWVRNEIGYEVDRMALGWNSSVTVPYVFGQGGMPF